MNEVKSLRKYFMEQQNEDCYFEQERLTTMKSLLKRVLDNVQVFDTR